MCSKNEYTKSESNSQHHWWKFLQPYDCVQRTNIQNLKAIHNYYYIRLNGAEIVFKERIYKIWKQFTTAALSSFSFTTLCSKNEYTKSESNSQRYDLCLCSPADCVQRTNIQNLKAIHNPLLYSSANKAIVFKERIYKIWKQFTTPTQIIPLSKHCVQRTNIQNLKAIHNNAYNANTSRQLCSKNEYTKSESNSQHVHSKQTPGDDCVQRTNIQNLKAIHNKSLFNKSTGALCSKNEYTKSESNSQHYWRKLLQSNDCVQRTNIQNLKAIHNLHRENKKVLVIVFKERIYKIWKQFTTSCV